MPVIGAVVVLSHAPEQRAAALEHLAQVPDLTLGELQGSRLPVVMETTSTKEDRRRFEELRAIEGVLLADPVFADFSDLIDPTSEVCS